MSDSANWSRRGFLTARGLGASAGGFLGAVLPKNELAQSKEQQAIGQWCFSRRAMNCDFSIFLPPTVPDTLTVAEAALDEIEQAEELLSIYRQTSALSYVNQHAAERPIRVDRRLFDLLKLSARLTEQTDGLFDISAGALIRAWGFDNNRKIVPTAELLSTAMAKVGMQHVELDDHEQAVHFQIPGLEINPGSIGKGWGIDRAIQRMHEEFDINCALIQGGLSSIYGLNSPIGDDRGWLVGIQNPFDSQQQVATVRLRNRALGTAGSTKQYFEADGRRYGHILNPRTGQPADELGSASVLADDAATADALATALFTMGLDKTADFCQNRPEIAALLVLRPEPGNQMREIPRVVTFNLPREDVHLSPG